MPDRICSIPACTNTAPARNSRCSACNYRWQRDTRATFEYRCFMCGKHYRTHRKYRGPVPTCSRSCASTYGNWIYNGYTPSSSRAVVPYPKLRHQAPSVIHVVSKSVHICGPCRVCGTNFVATHGEVTCSDDCTRERRRQLSCAKEHRRRARKRSQPAERFLSIEVFTRDSYRCHICRRKTRPDTHVLHPQHPTIDHLIPLARGGAHTLANVATACRHCNSVKSDRLAGDQLALL